MSVSLYAQVFQGKLVYTLIWKQSVSGRLWDTAIVPLAGNHSAFLGVLIKSAEWRL